MDYFLGQICLFGFDYSPKGWAFCDGRLLQINENSALFALLGTTYGGDGISTFALPTYSIDLPEGNKKYYCIVTIGLWPPRD